MIDDFAHHPTAVRETIEAVRSGYPGRRIWAVFEPRSNTSKRNVFERDFAAALARADQVIVAPVFQPEKVAATDRLSVDRVISHIEHLRGPGHGRASGSAEEISQAIARDGCAGDVVLVMSNGGFDNVHEKILRALAA